MYPYLNLFGMFFIMRVVLSSSLPSNSLTSKCLGLGTHVIAVSFPRLALIFPPCLRSELLLELGCPLLTTSPPSTLGTQQAIESFPSTLFLLPAKHGKLCPLVRWKTDLLVSLSAILGTNPSPSSFSSSFNFLGWWKGREGRSGSGGGGRGGRRGGKQVWQMILDGVKYWGR